MADNDLLWHQMLRRENYEPLEPAEAEAVATEATAILSRPESGASAAAHREQYDSIGYEIQIRGWDVKPEPAPLAELGGLTMYQLQPLLQRAIRSGTKYRVTPTAKKAKKSETQPQPASDALDRIRERLQRRKDTDK